MSGMKDILFEIAFKAQTLQERIDTKGFRTKVTSQNEDFEARLKEWKKVCSLGEEDIFDRRLVNDNIGKEELPCILGSNQLVEPGSIPFWTQRFEQILAWLDNLNYEDYCKEYLKITSEDEYSEIPFVHLLLPFTDLAINELKTNLNREIFSDLVLPAFRKQLLSIFSAYTAQTFHLEFQIFRSTRQRPFGRILSLAEGVYSVELYDEFVRGFYRGGWTGFFREYAALAKLITIVLENWIRNTNELLTAIANDYSSLEYHYSPLKKIGKAVLITSGISDSHSHGKRVSIISFESGFKIVFKPRNLNLECAFSNIIRQINATGRFPELIPLDVLNSGNYGWVGFIHYKDCRNEEQIRDYYRRTGMLICIVYILKGNDCHYENIIAHGEYPVLIDLETIMHPTAARFLDTTLENANFLASEQFGQSVLKTGLLPYWLTGKDDYTFDVSGTGGGSQVVTPYQYLEWKEINTDRMNASLKNVVSRENINIPGISGKRYFPTAYEEEIIEGFTHLYTHFRDHKEEFDFTGLAGQDIRFIFRNTRVYGQIQKKLRNPQYMRSGIDRSIQMEGLARAFLRQNGKNTFWNIFRSELRQMEELDIPIFNANSSGEDLYSGSDPVVRKFFEGAVYDQVIQRLDLVSEDDLNAQTRFIRASLFFKEYDEGINPVYDENLSGKLEEIQPLSREELIENATKIGEQIIENAIISLDKSVSWITVGTLNTARKLQMRPISLGLYDGICGVALFLGALYKITGRVQFSEMTYGALQSVRKTLSVIEEYPVYLRLFPIGAVSGMTSVIYSLVLLSEYLDDPELISLAGKLAGQISTEYIMEDKTYDILAGSSGALLGFIKLYNITGNHAWLEKAEICGDHLIKHRTQISEGMCGWPSVGGKMLSGFSHGAAGISYSLLRLYEINGNDELLKTATNAVRYENSLYRPEYQNWLDLREFTNNMASEKPNLMLSWCHGAPGIALARMASLHICDNEQIRFDIAKAIEKTRSFPMGKVDHLCCGNLGRAEILLCAAGKMNDPVLSTLAKKIAALTIYYKEQTGFYSLYHQTSAKVNNFGFFQGISGIGYEFLRLAEPDAIHPVLALE